MFSRKLGTDLRDLDGEQEFWPTFASATKNFAPLICRVVRAVLVLGAGLGFPVGAPAVFTPNLRLKIARLRCMKKSFRLEEFISGNVFDITNAFLDRS